MKGDLLHVLSKNSVCVSLRYQQWFSNRTPNHQALSRDAAAKMSTVPMQSLSRPVLALARPCDRTSWFGWKKFSQRS